MLFYKELNYPKIPKHFLNFTSIPLKTVNDIGYGGTFFKENNILTPCCYCFGLINDINFIEWLNQNLNLEFENVLYQEQIPKNKKNSTHIVHSDIQRKYALNYYIEEGGEGVLTTWYKEFNKPLTRTKNTGGMQADTGPVSYQNLEILNQVEFKKENWYILNVSLLHDVDNIQNTRKSISISLTDLQASSIVNS
jgi:hypothetical protein